jgi:hypothetical protein
MLRARESYSPFFVARWSSAPSWQNGVRLRRPRSIKNATGSPGSTSILSWTCCQHGRVPASPGIMHIPSRGGGDSLTSREFIAAVSPCRVAYLFDPRAPIGRGLRGS